ncbi:PadR family transcriptional regulator [Halomicroarcula sp. GCM10025709]|uniref:PadR family transcriptional regulator n=1 Tax=Haloarcula TaxID=2237 RepID=UPI0024C2C0EF|nr:helix-turn-helix transcriptional regulator [Halomicroarcula sp. YJ-61-S]
MSLLGATKESILRELKEEPKHGYAIADAVEISSGGVYTHLQDLEEAGMVVVDEEEKEGRGVTTYRLTEAGELLVEALEKADTA